VTQDLSSALTTASASYTYTRVLANGEGSLHRLLRSHTLGGAGAGTGLLRQRELSAGAGIAQEIGSARGEPDGSRPVEVSAERSGNSAAQLS
jgi:hypothetical protein